MSKYQWVKFVVTVFCMMFVVYAHEGGKNAVLTAWVASFLAYILTVSDED